MHRCGRSLLSKQPTNFLRPFSSTATAESATPIHRPNALTLIHKTSALLPSILPAAPKHPIESLELWTNLLDYAHNASVTRGESAGHEKQKARIVGAFIARSFSQPCTFSLLLPTPATVHGAHPDSSAFDLVTALLEDEFSSNPENTNLLRSRPRNITLSIKSGSPPTQSFNSLSLSSHWLTRFPTPVEIVELPTATSDADLITLLTADIPVVVINPIVTTPTAVLQSPLYRTVFDHPHAILVIIGLETPETRSYLQSLFASHSPRSESGSRQVKEGVETIWTKLPKFIYVNPSQALESMYALKKNPTSLQAIGDYQHGKLSSRISDFGSAVRENLTEAEAILGKDSPPCTFTAVALLRRSLNLARRSIDDSSREVDDLACGISELLGETERAKVCLHPDVLGVWNGVPGKETGMDEVKKAMVKSKEDVRRTLDVLGWWKLLWRVDDVQEIVNAAIRRQWCKDLERTVRLSPCSRRILGWVLNPHAALARLPHRPFASHPNSAQRQNCTPLTLFPPTLPVLLTRHTQQLPTNGIIPCIPTLLYRPPPTSFRSERRASRVPRNPASPCRTAGRVLHPWERNNEFGSFVGELGWAD